MSIVKMWMRSKLWMRSSQVVRASMLNNVHKKDNVNYAGYRERLYNQSQIIRACCLDSIHTANGSSTYTPHHPPPRILSSSLWSHYANEMLRVRSELKLGRHLFATQQTAQTSSLKVQYSSLAYLRFTSHSVFSRARC